MTGELARLLVEFQLAHADVAPPGWAVRVLARCGIAYMEIWDVFHQMYESQVCHATRNNKNWPLKKNFSFGQVPPFSLQSTIQTLSAAICVLFQDWLEVERHTPGEYFPADRIDSAVEQYLRELEAGDAQKTTREGYERIRRALRRFW